MPSVALFLPRGALIYGQHEFHVQTVVPHSLPHPTVVCTNFRSLFFLFPKYLQKQRTIRQGLGLVREPVGDSTHTAFIVSCAASRSLSFILDNNTDRL